MEERRREWDRRIEQGCREIRQRMEGVERRCEEERKLRKREWEALNGRAMTALEEHRHYNDELFRKMSVMTEMQLTILREIGEKLERESADGRAQLKANTEAVLRILDRLPPSERS